jgi:hypothetical protein
VQRIDTDEVRVSATVSWTNGSIQKSRRLSTALLNWDD